MKKIPFFTKGKVGGINFQQTNNKLNEIIFFSYFLIIFAFFCLLLIRLFQLTVVKGEYYRHLSEENRIREIIIEPKRGTIYDRKGLELAKNLPADIKKNSPRLTSARLYQEPEATAFILGYRQTADKEDVKNDRCLPKLKPGDKVGKKGVEKIFECQLKGKAGKKLIEVNAYGKFLKTLNIIPPTDGESLKLSVDLELQKIAYQKLKGKKGAIVAIKPSTGEILTLSSFPSFSPQDFEDEKIEILKNYLTDKEQPLFNRATAGLYPPGSIFKLVVAAAALEEKVIDETTKIEDTGIIKAGPLTFGNWYYLEYGKTEGTLDIVSAIKRSNDIFFYRLGEKLGVEKIKKWAEIFGYGQKTGIGLEEEEGLIPSPFWKKEILKDRWYLGDTYNLSIGQGYILVTPLQVALSTSVFANNGFLCQPTLLKVNDEKKVVCKKLPLSQKTLKLVKEGMRQACSPGGTGWPLFNFSVEGATAKEKISIETGCKTGTAESHGKNKSPHAWFTVFAPFDKPQIVVTVLVENGGQGADVAAPIAKEILKAYFERKE